MTARPTLVGASTCRVWWAAPVDPADAPHLLGILDAQEREQLTRFVHAADQARFLAAHALTRRALAAVLDTDAAELIIDRTCTCGEPHGKPSIANGPEFSLTHAGNVVGVAVHSRPVGLDVEQDRPMSDIGPLAARVCSPAEPVVDTEGFFRLWTRKEALLKATGRGLRGPMSDITLEGSRVAAWIGDGAPAAPVWLADLHPAPGHTGAVAGLGVPVPRVIEEDGNALFRW